MRSILIVLVLFLTFQSSFGQNVQQNDSVDALKYFDENKRWYNEFTEHWFYFHNISEEEIRNSISLWEQIGNDLKNPGEEWEGTYGNGGDTHGDYLRMSEKSGFIWLSVNKCQGGPMRITRGRVSATATGVKLIPEQTLGEMSSHGGHKKTSKNQEFLPVRWHSSFYLVSENAIDSFADYAAGLGEFNEHYFFTDIIGTSFFSKLNFSTDKKTGELPIFPKGYEKFVKNPVRAKIAAVGKSFLRADKENEDRDELITEISLEGNLLKGAKPGMSLHFVDEEEHPLEKIVIKRVGTNHLSAEVVRLVVKKNCKITEYDDCKDVEYAPIKIGQTLSSTGN